MCLKISRNFFLKSSASLSGVEQRHEEGGLLFFLPFFPFHVTFLAKK